MITEITQTASMEIYFQILQCQLIEFTHPADC